jgi:protein TonB
MKYKALLFCPDEASARLVTQVLSELDFTVELSFEPFVTVKKLADEPFDALVVDSTNEQDASLLFKGARNSTLNHSSLCVAVTDGQAGVAKAFRIGANLVLTKPINIEQSKNTLRVAKGLLKKNTAPAAGASSAPAPATSAAVSAPVPAQPAPQTTSAPAPVAPATPVEVPAAASAPAPPMHTAAASLLEAEQEMAPAAQQAFAESRLITKAAPEQSAVSPSPSRLEPPAPPRREPAAPARREPTVSSNPAPSIATRPAAAAPAIAPERAPSDRLPKYAKPAPIAQHEYIAPVKRTPSVPRPQTPLFSSYAQPARSTGGGKKAVLMVMFLALLGAGGYFGETKYHAWPYLQAQAPKYASRLLQVAHDVIHRAPKAASSEATAPAPAQTAEPEAKPSPSVTLAPAEPASGVDGSAPSAQPGNAQGQGASEAPVGFPTQETIEVPADSSVTVFPKPEPLRVKREAAKPGTSAQTAQLAPPPLVMPPTANPNVSKIIATAPVMPKTGAQRLRLSQGVTQGLLVKRVSPVYPQSALQMRKEGKVELLASVDKTGAISGLKVLSGDSIFAKAALEAVRQWKYRPYLLNGEPVVIETQITVVFKLPH